ncbi:hypothetical protein pb186bvf_013853 [Paramecium bursaria]
MKSRITPLKFIRVEIDGQETYIQQPKPSLPKSLHSPQKHQEFKIHQMSEMSVREKTLLETSSHSKIHRIKASKNHNNYLQPLKLDDDFEQIHEQTQQVSVTRRHTNSLLERIEMIFPAELNKSDQPTITKIVKKPQKKKPNMEAPSKLLKEFDKLYQQHDKIDNFLKMKLLGMIKFIN